MDFLDCAVHFSVTVDNSFSSCSLRAISLSNSSKVLSKTFRVIRCQFSSVWNTKMTPSLDDFGFFFCHDQHTVPRSYFDFDFDFVFRPRCNCRNTVFGVSCGVAILCLAKLFHRSASQLVKNHECNYCVCFEDVLEFSMIKHKLTSVVEWELSI